MTVYTHNPGDDVSATMASAVPGDIIELNNGTYTANKAFGNRYSFCGVLNNSGTSTQPIIIRAVTPGGVTFTPPSGYNLTGSSDRVYGIYLYNCSYWLIEGFNVLDMPQFNSKLAAGIYCELSDGIEVRRNLVSGIGGNGVVLSNSTGSVHHNIIKDCYDPLTSTPGGQADGIVFYNSNNADTKSYIYQNIVNRCSDDGIDFYSSESEIEVYENLVYSVGYDPSNNPAGNGNGFKIGPNTSSSALRYYHHNITAFSKNAGFSTNGSVGNYTVENNTSYKGGIGLDFSTDATAPVSIVDNISSGEAAPGFGTNVTHSNNTFDSSVTMSDSDFVSVDFTNALASDLVGGSDIVFGDLLKPTATAPSNTLGAVGYRASTSVTKNIPYSITDDDPILKVTINYGEGPTEDLIVTPPLNNIVKTHNYNTSGTYTVTITASDGTNTGSDTATVTIP